MIRKEPSKVIKSSYHLQKKEREITDHNELIALIKKGKFITISMCRENEPYIVTLSYGYDEANNTFYFHSALQGLKYEFLEYNSNVCATIIEDRGYIMGECAHAYRSVVIWGEMHVVKELEEKKHAMDILLLHLEDNPGKIKKESLSKIMVYKSLGILRLDVKEIRGKRGR